MEKGGQKHENCYHWYRRFRVFISDQLCSKQEVDENVIQSRLKRVKLSNNIDESLYNSSCICVLTEWDEFFNYNWEKTKNRPEIIFDGRNFLNTNKLKKIFKKVISLGK